MGKTEDAQLQRYFDGALDEHERRAAEAALTDEDRERLAALGEMQSLVRGGLEAEAAQVDLWPAIEARLEKAEAKQRAVRRWRMGARGMAGLSVAAAALGAFLFLVHPWHLAHPSNGCDVESLEVEGAVAAVLTVDDTPHHGDGPTTIIWTEED
jgi:anti-sigma factor RsiW